MSLLRPTWLEKSVFGALILVLLVFCTYLGWAFLDMMSSPGPPRPPEPRALVVAAATFLGCVLLLMLGIAAVNRQQQTRQATRDAESRELFDRLKAGEALPERLFLYLRPFSAKDQKTATEQLVIQLFETHGTLICVDEPAHQLGMGRVAFSDEDWQPAVLELCERATAIIIYPGATEGTLWELQQLSSRGWLDKTLIFMPPNIPLRGFFAALASAAPAKNRARLSNVFDLSHHWDRARARAQDVGVELPAYDDSGGLYRYVDEHLECLSSFGREHLFGHPPREAQAALEPVIASQVRGMSTQLAVSR